MLCRCRLHQCCQENDKAIPRSEMDSSGWVLVDTPTRQRKETLDKKIIVDVMETGLANPSSCLIVLISSDGDYAYMLNRLRDYGVRVLLIHKKLVDSGGNTPGCLYDSADTVMSWNTVLEPAFLTAEFVEGLEQDQEGALGESNDETNSILSDLDPAEGDFDALLLVVAQLHDEGPEWVPEAQVGTVIAKKSQLPHEQRKLYLRKLRTAAVDQGLLVRKQPAGKVHWMLQLSPAGQALLDRSNESE
eukprot:TRINITY_DN12429_c0_g2_i8.p1 TRINITY_DN12429_c0_g2~~TRINITY_DN12429_c0_g2_i8.p1  ORF type:complete len:246 (-),score=30.84 TRINITY_DN12429_c0_g2_i8:499-1236(-)